MDFVTPSIGLIFWTGLVFIILLLLLTKFAWKPVLAAVKNRENSIAEALQLAEETKAEMLKLKSDNENLLKEARAERDIILKEARDAKDNMIADAKNKAQVEADRMITSAKAAINNEKMAAITEMKNQVAVISLEIAEKILKQELASDEKQKALIGNLMEDVNLN
jgi:F-type H+-transporting ATPase subunit b